MINSDINVEFTRENCKICGMDDFHLLRKSQKYHFGRCRNCGFFYLNPMPKMIEKGLTSGLVCYCKLIRDGVIFKKRNQRYD